MRLILCLMSLTLLTGCFGAWRANDSALCDGTTSSRADHAAALIVDGGPASKRTGAVLLVQLREGCRE